jgi:large subunit ribosomal protein L4
MVKVPLYNQNGEMIKEIELPKEIFEVKINPNFLHQVVVSQMSNRRQGTAHTKTRAEVSGGGRKPWPQKGLGLARHGSIRSPIWKGGGVAHGPRKEKNYKKKIPKKMRRKALFMALSSKAKDNELILLEDLKVEKGKTKEMAKILENLKIKGKSTLVALPSLDKKVILAARNIPKVSIIQAKDLNALDVLNSKYLLMPLESIEVIKKTFLKK